RLVHFLIPTSRGPPPMPFIPPCLRIATLPCLCVLGSLCALGLSSVALPASAADLTDQLQAAIDAGSGLVEVPPGEHELSRPLRVDLATHGRTVIRGNGASRLVMTAAGPAIEIIG